ncbi:hypothetical protein L6164_012114 [Bauhinia variegata]|uniref:Uncharacterized protein n=1 Tax=Bauhinia variegata TaxID=167791 RepID=A0ACB9P834_BAUVA|nr:hypothetical protein L6164_012114 [Bauhinia variegata]
MTSQKVTNSNIVGTNGRYKIFLSEILFYELRIDLKSFIDSTLSCSIFNFFFDQFQTYEIGVRIGSEIKNFTPKKHSYTSCSFVASSGIISRDAMFPFCALETEVPNQNLSSCINLYSGVCLCREFFYLFLAFSCDEFS